MPLLEHLEDCETVSVEVLLMLVYCTVKFEDRIQYTLPKFLSPNAYKLCLVLFSVQVTVKMKIMRLLCVFFILVLKQRE